MQYNHTMNKKALISFNMINMIPKLIFLIIVLLSVVILIGIFINMGRDIYYKEADLFTLNLFYSPHGISYFNPDLNRITSGIIDEQELISNITEKRLNNSFYYGRQNEHLAAKIQISKQTLSMPRFTSIKTIYYNQGKTTSYGYKFWEPLSFKEGIGSPYYFARTMPIQIRTTSGTLQDGILAIEVLIKRT